MEKRVKKVILGLEKLRVDGGVDLYKEDVQRLLRVMYGMTPKPIDKIFIEALERRIEEIGGLSEIDLNKFKIYNLRDIGEGELIPFKVNKDYDIECEDDSQIKYNIADALLSKDWLVYYKVDGGYKKLIKVPREGYKKVKETELKNLQGVKPGIYGYIGGYMYEIDKGKKEGLYYIQT